MKAVLIDDELHSLEILKYELGKGCPEVNVIGSALGGMEGLQMIKTLKPDIVFLDIEMPMLNGFDLLEKLDQINFMIVFITAFDQYAIKAFKYSAIDYLLKPVTAKDLVETVERINFMRNRDSLKFLRSILKEQKEKTGRVALAVGSDIVFVKPDEIVRCKADGNYTNVFTKNGRTIYVSRSIKDLGAILESENFIKCHQSHLVNKNHVQAYSKTEGGYLLMNDKAQVPISRANKDYVQKSLMP